MAQPDRSRKRKGNPKPKPPTRRGRLKKTDPPAKSIPLVEFLPKHLEHFCWAIYAGKPAREAAVEIGRKSNSGFYLRHHPAVQKRLKEIEKEYQGIKLEAEGGEILNDRFVDENMVDIIANGEDGEGTGRVKAVELVWKRKRYIDLPDAKTLIALNMQSGLNSAPKLFIADRFNKLHEQGAYKSEHLMLAAKPEGDHA